MSKEYHLFSFFAKVKAAYCGVNKVKAVYCWVNGEAVKVWDEEHGIVNQELFDKGISGLEARKRLIEFAREKEVE